MSDFGVKLSLEHEDVQKAKLDQLVFDPKYPLWKCDVRANPKHYGLLKITASIPAGQRKTVFSMRHGYDYVPSFIAMWNYPAGTGGATPQTFGIGNIEINLVTLFKPTMTDSLFTIELDNTANGSAANNLYAEIRYYIFADDFPRFNFTGVGLDG